MSEKTRSDFEAWDRAQYEIDPETYERKYEGRYMDRAIQCRWETWLSSRRQALEETAAICDRLATALDHGGNEYRREASASVCASAIRREAAE